MRIRNLSLCLLASLLLMGPQTSSQALTPSNAQLTEQQLLFRATELALINNNRPLFAEGLSRLTNYPLHSFLLFADLNSRLNNASADEVRAFLNAHGDSPHGEHLRQAWLTHLAQNERWADLAQDFRPGAASTTLVCYYRQALLHLGQTEQALRNLGQIWLQRQALPDSCEPLLAEWQRAGGLTPALVWQRIRLLMAANQPKLARQISHYLPAGEGPWFRRWLDLNTNPAAVTELREWTAASHPQAPAMLTQAWISLAQQDPTATLALWQAHHKRQRLPPESVLEVERALALRLVLRTRAASLPHLAQLADEVFDAQLREWQVRAALEAGDWLLVNQSIKLMETQQRNTSPWRYWQARALEALGYQSEARALYQALAQERNFYGFMAADRLGLPYNIENHPLVVSQAQVRLLAAQPALRRTYEWLALGRHVEARREWQRIIANLDSQGLRTAAALAHQWNWHDRAIFTVAQAQDFGDIYLRFPLAHASLIREQSTQHGINPAWAMAVTRQESSFKLDARSHAGALGLMQLMPATGLAMANRLGIPLSGNNDLFDPNINVAIGTYYLRRKLDRFNGHPVLATAAYNAGASRVSGWLPRTGEMAADIWMELIPFHETRNYVRLVLTYQMIYEQRLGLAPTSISSLLTPITAQTGESGASEAGKVANPKRASITTAPQDQL